MPLVRHRRVLILGYRGVAYKMVVMGKDEFQLQVVDTAGQDEYTILPHSFVISIRNYVLAYSVPSLQTFRVVKTLHNKLSESWGKMQSVLSLPGKGVPGGAGSSPFPCLQCACGAGGEQGRPVPAEVRRALGVPSPPAVVSSVHPPSQGPGGPSCCASGREVKTDEGKKLAGSWGTTFLKSLAKESQVWGRETDSSWVLGLMSPHPQLAQGIFTKIIEEMDQADDTYSRLTGCHLM
ncbi:GTPase RhebL1 isoform X1 [Grus americana]|uniref:GTPase RhebL1 isoform X1 n=1 Tax=Grus americana TaxID=9117 RepID=UPI00240886E3|nr:GTPase RhebL1 isoform X1 [Grus americana]